MCGRFCCSLCPSDLKNKLTNNGLDVNHDEWVDQDKYRPRYNVAPRTFVPVVRQNDDKNQLVLQTMKWGLIPFFSKTMPDMQPINARDDSLLEGSPMYNKAKNDKRCIVVADGFYEWKKLGNGKKAPYYTKRKDGQLMLFAGLYDISHPQDWDQDILYSTTIVTTGPSSFFSFLHDRMPVILEQDEARQWLDPTLPWSPSLAKLMKPYQGELDCYQVTDKVGPVSNESSDFIIPVDSLKGSISSFFGKPSSSPVSSSTKSSPDQSAKLSSQQPQNQQQQKTTIQTNKRKAQDENMEKDINKKIKSTSTQHKKQDKKKHITNFFNKK
ncbi:hypothetical protein BCR42DRAFT_25594 [Absidia repens]|uniref:DUF159-domain-containing protein n=1 Tax=Absidia repens TaxID=90262 RepID=A0A1X2IIB5_9FUNG|nr:hypothetical protein BCR42DRAFT_25594 [Absidia repens]